MYTLYGLQTILANGKTEYDNNTMNEVKNVMDYLFQVHKRTIFDLGNRVGSLYKDTVFILPSNPAIEDRVASFELSLPFKSIFRRSALASAIMLCRTIQVENNALIAILHDFIESKERFKKAASRYRVLKGGGLAFHKLGEISRNEDDIIIVNEESKNFYVGSFAEGFGFFGVKFLKSDTRELTPAEKEKTEHSQLRVTQAFK